MSSDNYNLIRKRGGRYYLETNLCASAPELPELPPFTPDDPDVQAFATLDEALTESMKHYAEYGTEFADEGLS